MRVKKFFDVSDDAPQLNKQPFKFFLPLLERIAGLAWFNKQTLQLRLSDSFNLSTALPELFPSLNIRHKVSIFPENPIMNPSGKIIVANHEGYLLDLIFLAWILNKNKSNFKYIAASDVSCSLLADYCFFLDIKLTKKKDAGKNIMLYQQAIGWLREGKTLVIFPEVHAEKKISRKWEKKLPWSSLPYALAKAANVPIIPIKLDIPLPCFSRALRVMFIFFYNINMTRMARACHYFCGTLSFWQIKFAARKIISCVIGPALTLDMYQTKGSHLRNYVYQLEEHANSHKSL